MGAADELVIGKDLEAARVQAERDGRPLLITFGAAWCSACRELRTNTLKRADVQAAGAAFHIVFLELDRNTALARAYRVAGTPHFFVERANGEVLLELVGGLPGPGMVAFLSEGARRAREGRGSGPAAWADGDNTPVAFDLEGYRGLGICFSHVGYGPLQLPSQSPGQVLRFGLRPETPSTLTEGQWEVTWTESFANVFAFRRDDFRLDYLTLNSALAVAYGLSNELKLEFNVRNLSRYDSFLDPITDAFHDLFGLGASGRDEFPDNDNVISLEAEDGIAIEDRRSGTESTDIGVLLQHNLTCGTATLPALSYSIGAQAHLGGHADLEGANPFSVGLSFASSRRVSREIYLYGGLAFAWHGLDQARGLPLDTRQASGLFAVEWRYGPDRSWVLQYLVSEGVAETRDPFDAPSHEINLGWKWEYDSNRVFEIGLIENIIEVDNSPDFGLHFGLRRRF